MSSVTVSALYKFVILDDYRSLRNPLLSFCQQADITGTLLLAREGINGTIAGSTKNIERVLEYLRADPRFADLTDKKSKCDGIPFLRMKVKLKKEIVSIGLPEVSPTKCVGEYVDPEDWNALISDPDVLLVDTRNDYEVDIGTFEGAINPNTKTFRDFPDYVSKNLDPSKQRKVAMFCTGGIRCEKASSLMLEQGFDKVYHLNGGILKYLETVKKEESKWQGECFVFDQRISVKHNLEQGKYQQCYGCRHPIDDKDIASPYYKKGVQCPHCYKELTPSKQSRFEQRQLQVDLAKKRNDSHIAKYYPRHHPSHNPDSDASS